MSENSPVEKTFPESYVRMLRVECMTRRGERNQARLRVAELEKQLAELQGNNQEDNVEDLSTLQQDF